MHPKQNDVFECKLSACLTDSLSGNYLNPIKVLEKGKLSASKCIPHFSCPKIAKSKKCVVLFFFRNIALVLLVVSYESSS